LRANTVPVSYGIDVSGETGLALKRWRSTQEEKHSPTREKMFI
jgi:hypothetical protein